MHVSRLLEQPATLDRYGILTLPGGFSYGDDISAGRILANRLAHRMGEQLRDFVRCDRLVLGICNGFQVLVKAGLLTAGSPHTRCTLALNAQGRFVCQWTSLRCDTQRCVFLERGRRYFLPIAHAEGRFAVANAEAYDRSLAALRYTRGEPRTGPANPTGSFDDVAGLTDETGRVLGLMPHPERFVDPSQHPFATAADDIPEPDGLAIFRAAVEVFR